MIKYILSCVLAFVLVNNANAYEIKFKSNCTQGYAYLTYYFGNNLNIEDSAAINNKGEALFKKDKTLPGGIYAVVYNDKKTSTEFLVDKQQSISIVADMAKPAEAIITGSDENILFRQYQMFVNEQGKKLNNERRLYTEAQTAADSILHEKNYSILNKELNDYRLKIVTEKPKSMMAALLEAMKASPIPEKQPLTRQDSLDNFQFYKTHFWDGITFMDGRIVRTPFFLPKLERYYREVLAGMPADTLIKDIDYKLLLARTAPEMYKLLLNWFTDEYINPKYMGQDAIFVHLFEKYHSKGLTPWLNETQMKSISNRAYMQMSNLLGNIAANMEMLNTADKPTALYDVNADYTLVLFWDPNCGHCKEELPRIDSVYQAKWKNENVKIYAVLTEDNHPLWLNYIKEHNLSDWVNVYQSAAMQQEEQKAGKISYRQLYDVIMTPTLFLLDKEKRIIGKKLTWQQLDELLDVKIAAAKNN